MANDPPRKNKARKVEVATAHATPTAPVASRQPHPQPPPSPPSLQEFVSLRGQIKDLEHDLAAERANVRSKTDLLRQTASTITAIEQERNAAQSALSAAIADRDRATADLAAVNKLYTDERAVRKSLAARITEQDEALNELAEVGRTCLSLKQELAELQANHSALTTAYNSSQRSATIAFLAAVAFAIVSVAAWLR